MSRPRRLLLASLTGSKLLPSARPRAVAPSSPVTSCSQTGSEGRGKLHPERPASCRRSVVSGDRRLLLASLTGSEGRGKLHPERPASCRRSVVSGDRRLLLASLTGSDRRGKLHPERPASCRRSVVSGDRRLLLASLTGSEGRGKLHPEHPALCRRTDIFMDRNMFEHLNIVADRYTTDKVIDATGKKLLDFCSNTCMLIVNDRTGKKSSGGATCKGVSTIDYAIASSDLFKHINDFHIDIFDKCLSDIHSPIYLELNSLLCTDFPEPNINQENVIMQDTTQLNQRKRTTKTNWDPTKKNAFTEAINTPHIKHLTQQITNLGQNLELVSQSEINSLTETLEKMYEDAGVETGITKI